MESRWLRLPIAGACALALAATTHPAVAATASTERISVSATGGPGDLWSESPSISDDGRYVAFSSAATDLVAGDTNNKNDVFVRDRRRGTTVRPLTGYDGSEPAHESWDVTISGTGRYVAFMSDNPRLVPGDTNAEEDVFVRDLRSGTITRVSVTGTGAEADGASGNPGISADGRYVAFISLATNLLPADANGPRRPDVFVRDLLLGTTTLVSTSLTGAGGNRSSLYPVISRDGRYVAFRSSATDLVADGSTEPGLFVRDLRTGSTTRESLTSAGAPAAGVVEASMSRDGRFVTFDSRAGDVVPGDTNGVTDAFVRDRGTGAVERVSVATGGVPGDDSSNAPVVSDGGRCVAFYSMATNLVPADGNGVTDVFVRDRRAGTTTRLSLSEAGGDPDDHSFSPAISAGGRRVAFVSWATNLQVPADPNAYSDIFTRGTGCG